MGKPHELHWALPGALGYSLKMLGHEVPVAALPHLHCVWNLKNGGTSKMQVDGWAYLSEKLSS
jgi:hypothetical protein